MSLEDRIRAAERELFSGLGLELSESFLALRRTGLRVRVLSAGTGRPLVFLHGVSLSTAVWAPLLRALTGYRMLAVDLPGHGLSDPVAYERGRVREHSQLLLEDILDALELEQAPLVGHSLGGMLALWHAAADSGRISSVVAIADPAVALPGVRVRMPLSLLTVPGLGLAVLRSPSPMPVYRQVLAQGLGREEVSAAPEAMIEALRLSARRPQNAGTVASLMHAINHFRRPRDESVLSSAELAAISIPTTFVWGSDDPYLSPAGARPAIDQIRGATLHEVRGGHGPWLVDPQLSARLIEGHLAD